MLPAMIPVVLALDICLGLSTLPVFVPALIKSGDFLATSWLHELPDPSLLYQKHLWLQILSDISESIPTPWRHHSFESP